MEKCSVRVGGEGYSASSGSPCQNPAKVVRDGMAYCGMHDPDAIKARQESRYAKFNIKWAAEREASRRKAVVLNLAFGISTKVFDQKASEIRGFLETLQEQLK